MPLDAILEGLEAIEKRPCEHNDWDDVRTRKGYKVLRCRDCQQRWKIPSNNVPRCMPFLHSCCDKKSECNKLHVRRKKNTVEAPAADDWLTPDIFPLSPACDSDPECFKNPYFRCFAPPNLPPQVGWYQPIAKTTLP
eukprot:TRINITY_DN14935_c1_g1_i1.p1 TRINITY_DN14935_c1_g1~~TRINITY_DN14935_c1_g1_i1.p1  ORF type:complete len:137 (+),score=20.68 TRINITY_DN14935_c1_g1_i1:53-463(+)